jgi:hypothetical protein
MADITMCLNLSCPLRKVCHRATAYQSEYQTVALFEPDVVGGKVVCDHYWDNEGYKKYDDNNNPIK